MCRTPASQRVVALVALRLWFVSFLQPTFMADVLYNVFFFLYFCNSNCLREKPGTATSWSKWKGLKVELAVISNALSGYFTNRVKRHENGFGTGLNYGYLLQPSHHWCQ